MISKAFLVWLVRLSYGLWKSFSLKLPGHSLPTFMEFHPLFCGLSIRQSQRDPREISGSLFLSKLSSLELCPTTGSIFCFPEIRALSSHLGDSCSACDPSPRPFSLHCGPEGASKQKDTAVVGVTSLVLFPSLRDHTLALLLVQGLKPSVPHITFLVVYDTGDPVSP